MFSYDHKPFLWLATLTAATVHPPIRPFLCSLRLSQLDPSQCVVVEDSLIGCKAAKAAGCNCIITYTDSTVQEDFYGEGASAVVEDLSNFGGIKLADVLVEDGVEIMKGKKEGMDR